MELPSLNWSSGMPSAAPPPGEVYVWAFPLGGSPEQIARCASILSDDEGRRASEFKMEHLGRRYRVAHGLMRTLLGQCLQRPPQTLEFEFGPRGKPRLRNSALEFNLAHSGELGLLAVSGSSPVGVDVEQLRPMPDGLDIARRFFSAREVAMFEDVAATEHDVAFFNLWTRKEAWLKATGEGIAESLSKVEFAFRPGEAARVLAIDGDAKAAENWSLCALQPSSDYVGALAIPLRTVRVTCWTAVA